MKFSFFMMPIHHPSENPALAFDEFFIGEHHSGGLFARYVIPHFRGHTQGYRDEWDRLRRAAAQGGVKVDSEGRPSNLARSEDGTE